MDGYADVLDTCHLRDPMANSSKTCLLIGPSMESRIRRRMDPRHFLSYSCAMGTRSTSTCKRTISSTQ
jgi:hypothetical protein